MSDKVQVEKFPPCDICKAIGTTTEAHYDGKTIHGPWAYMCEAHFKLQGVGLGTGKGQRLILSEPKKGPFYPDMSIQAVIDHKEATIKGRNAKKYQIPLEE